MSITSKSLSIWLITNFTGTILYSFIPLSGNDIEIHEDPGLAILMLVCGLVLSSPAIIFSYINLLFIKDMRTENGIKYLYTVFSVLLFICIAALLLVTLTGGQIPSENGLKGFQLIWAHTLMAIVTTVWFARDIIEKNYSSATATESNMQKEENVIHKL